MAIKAAASRFVKHDENPSGPIRQGSFFAEYNEHRRAGGTGAFPESKIKEDYLQLIFPIENLFLLGSPLGMLAATYADEPFIRSKLPTCDNFYNIFHPADLVTKRIEPLIKHFEYPEWKYGERSHNFV